MVKKVNIILPKHWNGCTTEQLELIADVMREQVERQDRYHSFSMQKVKVALFFTLTGIEVVEGIDASLPTEKQYYLCRMKGGKETFPLYLWQVNYWLSPKAKIEDKGTAKYMAQGADVLGWLDNDNGMYLTLFPYDAVKRKKSNRWFSRKKEFRGPRPDLDGFSWAQYRFASDMMQTYTQLSNSLVKMTEKGTFTKAQMEKQTANVRLAKSMFLATIFNGKTKYIDANTGMVRYDFHYDSSQCSENADYFRGFNETQWQVVLFWWTGIMNTLSKRFPHVFKVQSTGKRKPGSPLEIYTATTATMQKYAGLTEDQVNNQSYSLVLEHLERLSKENEEMEKIRSKK